MHRVILDFILHPESEKQASKHFFFPAAGICEISVKNFNKVVMF